MFWNCCVSSLLNMSYFLDPDYVRSLNLGGNLELLCMIWAPMSWYQSVGKKGSVLRPRCIGTQKTRPQLLSYYFNLFSPNIY